ncbi:MAG: hypothetical protein ACPL7B_03800 [Candidatus Poribacteria bacterium]
MNKDIRNILDSWEYNPNIINVRKIIGNDGKEKIQIRVALGILQMEVDGRPDGKTPYNEESLLDYYKSLLKSIDELDGEGGLLFTDQDMKDIETEIMQYYHRRMCFFILKDYTHAKRDAEHNLQLMDLIKKYCKDEEYIRSHERYRPFVIMEMTRAESLEYLRQDDYANAMKSISDAINAIESFYRENGIDEDELKKIPELILLKRWRAKIHQDWEGGVTEMDEDDPDIDYED